ncbi:MAG: DUF87 domain-containing protein [Thermotogae bacterium]|nr:DUF87 domain-containing protein [Thermotogota bacterium]
MRFIHSDDLMEEMEKLVESAREYLYIASAWVRSGPLSQVLNGKVQNGVKIEIVIRASEFKDAEITDPAIFKVIEDRNGSIYVHPRLHAKFIIADGRKAIVGSSNYTFSGLSDYGEGNVEANVLIDDAEEVGKLKDYFQKIKEEATHLTDEIVGFALNPVKSDSFEFVLLEDLSEGAYVKVPLEDGILLAQIDSIYAYDVGFFANPFSSNQAEIFAPYDLFRKIFARSDDPTWRKFAAMAHLNGNGGAVRVALASVLGLLRGSRLRTNLTPFQVGTPILKASEEDIAPLLGEGSDRVYVGELYGSGLKVHADLNEMLSKHVLVVGTTGSGKSHFTKRLIKEILEGREDVRVVVLDPHGEYASDLKNLGVAVEPVRIPDTLFPISVDDLKSMFPDLAFLLSSAKKEIKEAVVKIRKALGTRLGKVENLYEILKDLRLDGLLGSFLEEIEGCEECRNQHKVAKEISAALESDPRILVFDFSNLTDAKSRSNIAGMILRWLFEEAKKHADKNLRRLIVLEEAHNFAPEKAYADVSAGRDNLSLTYSQKIAAEGRKFNLGLLAITQRPAQVSKYVLSQTNTQFMFRVINRGDLDALEAAVEYAGGNVIARLPSLGLGTMIATGVAFPFPVMVQVDG